MKIGLCHNLYGGLSRGGAETTVLMMADELIKAGHEVFIITTKTAKDIKPNSDSCPVYYIKSEYYNLNKHNSLYRLIWQIINLICLRKYWQIKRILISNKPDLVITHNLMGLGFLTPRAIRRLKIRHEHFLHDIQLLHPSGLMIWGQEKKLQSLSARIYRAITKRLFGSPDKIISPSKWLLGEHEKFGFFAKSAKEVRPFKWPASSKPKVSRTDKETRFLFIGQIEKTKGVFLLIDAFKKISDVNFRLTFAIRGGGADLAEAKLMSQSDKRIIWLGPLSYEKTENIKAENDCLIVPSLCYENSPTVIYGAQATGLAIIAANIGGIPELMKPQDRLFRPGDVENLRQRLVERGKN